MKQIIAALVLATATSLAAAGGGHRHNHHGHHGHRGGHNHWAPWVAGAVIGAAAYGAYRYNTQPPPAVVYGQPYYPQVYIERPQVCSEWYLAQDQWGRQFWTRNCY